MIAPVRLVVGSINTQNKKDPADYTDGNGDAEAGVSGVMVLGPATGHDVVRMIADDNNPGASIAATQLGVSDKSCLTTEMCRNIDGSGYNPTDTPVVCERNGYVPDPSGTGFERENPGTCVPESFHRSKHALLQNGTFVYQRPGPKGDQTLGHYCDPDPSKDAGCDSVNSLTYACRNAADDSRAPGYPSKEECLGAGKRWVGETYDVMTQRMVGFKMSTGNFYREDDRATGDIKVTGPHPDAMEEQEVNELSIARVMENVIGPLMSSQDAAMDPTYGTRGVKVRQSANGDQTRYYMKFKSPDASSDDTGASTLVCQTMPTTAKVPDGTQIDTTGDDYNLACFYRGPHIGGVFDKWGTIGLAYDSDQGQYIVDVHSSLTQGRIKFDGEVVVRDNGEHHQLYATCDNLNNALDTYDEDINNTCSQFTAPFRPDVMNAIQTQKDNGQVDFDKCPNTLSNATIDTFLKGLNDVCGGAGQGAENKSDCCAYIESWLGPSEDEPCPIDPNVDQRNLQAMRGYQQNYCANA